MAISLSSTTTKTTTTITVCSLKTTPLSTRRRSSSRNSSLQFQTRRVSSPPPPLSLFTNSTPSRSRVSHIVAATKQTFSNFDELLQNSDKPVLVDFYATWCGPCQFMAPILNEVSGILKETIQVVKIDTEKYPKIADQYCIEALPTFILFKDGKPFDRFEGALTKEQLIQRIENMLKVKQ